MLSLQAEIRSIATARTEQRTLRLLADALTGAVLVPSLDPQSQSMLRTAAAKHGVLGFFPLRGSEGELAAARARSLRATRFTHRAVDAIERAGIVVVVLKGAAAAARWLDPTLRQQGDVDLLVNRRDKDAAAKALIAAGVCSERFLESQHMHNDSLSPRDPSGLLVELHHYFNMHHETLVDVTELLERRVRIKTPQGGLPALAPEDDGVYLALHATTHALQRLAWMVDLAALDIDWVESARRARKWGVGLAVAPAWLRARELLGKPIPEAAFEALGVNSAHERLSSAILALAEQSGGEVHRFFERTFRLSVVPTTSLPRVFIQKMRGRREEREAYAKKGIDFEKA